MRQRIKIISLEELVILFIGIGLILSPMDAWLLLPLELGGIKLSIARIIVLASILFYIALSIYKNKFLFAPKLSIVILWTILYLLSSLWIKVPIENLLVMRKIFSLVFANLLIFSGYLIEKYKKTSLVSMTIISISVIFALIEQILGFRPYFIRQHEFFWELTGFYINPAHLGSTLALLYPFFRMNVKKGFNYILDFVLFFIILRTGSKGAILAFLFSFLLLSFYIKNMKKEMLIYLSIGVLLGYFLIKKEIIPKIIIEKINFLAFTALASESFLERTLIYEKTFKYITQNPLIGYGIGSSLIIETSSHNLWLELWFEGGIINLFLFCVIYLGLIFLLFTRLFNKKDSQAIVYLIPLVSFIPISLTVGSVFTLWSFWITLGICLYRA